MTRPAALVALSILASACGNADPTDCGVAGQTRYAEGSLLLSTDETALYAPLSDDGLIVRYDLDDREISTLDLGGSPSRLARMGDRLLLSLRAERAIATLEEEDGQLVEVDRIEVGAEPVGLVRSADGQRVYVALSTAQEVVELGADLSLLRHFPLSGDPEWVALHPSGETLYVGTVSSGAYFLDLTEEEPTAISIELPDIMGMNRRVTGDLSISPDGRRLAVPAVWQDVMRPSKHSDEEAEQLDPAIKFEEIGLGISPNNPGIVLYDLDARGQPEEEGLALYGAGRAVTTEGEAPRIVRSIFSNVHWAPDGETLLASMEGSRVVAAFDPDPDRLEAGPSGFYQSPVAWLGTGQVGASGIAFLGGRRAFVLNWVDRSISELD